MKNLTNKLAPLGSLLSAFLCPICFPALASISSALGFTFLFKYENEALIVMQILIVLSVFFAYLSYKKTKYLASFTVSILSAGVLFSSWYLFFNQFIIYSAITGLVIGSFWNFWIEKKLSSCKDRPCLSKI